MADTSIAPIARANIIIDKQLLRIAVDPAVMVGAEIAKRVDHFLKTNPDTESFGDLIVTVKVTDRL